jgi:hypothetical protein
MIILRRRWNEISNPFKNKSFLNSFCYHDNTRLVYTPNHVAMKLFYPNKKATQL